MPVTLPTEPLATQADLAALDARVTALEGGQAPGPTPPDTGDATPSPTGHYISTPEEPPVIDDEGHAWSLVASADKGNQIAVAAGSEAPVVEEYSANVAKLGITEVDGARRVAQENAAGDQYWTTGPGQQWTQHTPPPQPIAPGERFQTRDGEVYKPDGTPWKPTGMNLWWAMFSNRDGGWNQADQVIADWNTGAPLLTQFPNLNLIRLLCFRNSSQLGGLPTCDELRQLVDFCTARRIVLLVDPHDYSGGSNYVYNWADGSLQEVCDWIGTIATEWKDNPYVLFQTENEPGEPNSDEINAIYDAVRNTGNENMIIIGWVTWGWTSRIIPGITERMRNVAGDWHYYAYHCGSEDMNIENHKNWIANLNRDLNNTYRSQDGVVPQMIMEFGDACCGAVEAAGNVAVEAVCQSVVKGWCVFNWTTWWNCAWGVDVLNEGTTNVKGGPIAERYMIGV